MTKISAFSQAHPIFGTVDSLHLFFLQAWVPLSSLKHFTKYQRFFSCPEFLINWVTWSRTVYLVQLYQGNTHNYIFDCDTTVTAIIQNSDNLFYLTQMFAALTNARGPRHQDVAAGGIPSSARTTSPPTSPPSSSQS